jgi:hypothetical protein
MATIKANGGAASVWERTGHHSGGMPYTVRVVLCRNGKVITGVGAGAYHHAQGPKLAALAGQPLDSQEVTRQLGFARATSDAQVRASTTVAAYWHRQQSTRARSVVLPAPVEGRRPWHGSRTA